MNGWMRAAHAALMALAVSTTGCHGVTVAQGGGDRGPSARTTPLDPSKPLTLGINGFNYTDLVISAFNVGSQGGGNIFVSSPTSGGGGTTCCIRWWSNTPLPWPIEVEWMRYLDRKQRWCKKTVMFNGPVPASATAIGVHFMPDGDIQIEMSEGYPDLRLSLDSHSPAQRKATGNVIHDERTANCRDGY
jgi:Protein of unknown function (DUF3304)